MGGGRRPSASRYFLIAVAGISVAAGSAAAAETSIGAGNMHGVALKPDGTVWTWGDNRSGQLGRMDAEGWAPAPVPDLKDVVSVAAGSAFSLALKSDGTVWKWGDGVAQPAKVEGLSRIMAISANGEYTLALDREGRIWQWGTLRYRSAIPRPQVMEATTPFVAISAADTNGLALDREGKVWVWGETSGIPSRIEDVSDVSAIAGGYQRVVMLKRDGTVWEIGYGAGGKLGHRIDVPTPVVGLTGVKKIASSYMTVFALKSDGTLWAWGGNHDHHLGKAGFDADESATPVRVGSLTRVTAVGSADYHAAALTADGVIWTWGQNNEGALGADPENLRQSDVPMRAGQPVPAPCRPPLFSCEVKGGKGIELCGEPDERDSNVWSNIQYRFGPSSGPPELMFPPEPADAPPSLFFSDESSGGEWRQSVRFTNDGYTYTLSYGDIAGGVEVRDAKGKLVANVACIERPYVHAEYLRMNLPCDPKSPKPCKK
jgi:alpha-tubulin suppressor-like RCC1 family protein